MTIRIQNDGQYNYININPINARIIDSQSCSQLFITSVVDNPGASSATIFWQLRTTLVAAVAATYDSDNNLITAAVPAVPGNIMLTGNIEMTGATYAGWGTDDTYPFQVLLNNYPAFVAAS